MNPVYSFDLSPLSFTAHSPAASHQFSGSPLKTPAFSRTSSSQRNHPTSNLLDRSLAEAAACWR